MGSEEPTLTGEMSWSPMVFLGNFRGVSLVSYDKEGKNILGTFEDQYRVFTFDGRLPHQLKFDNFEGTRFAVLVYKAFDTSFYRETPFLHAPGYVNASMDGFNSCSEAGLV